jgi:valyl-tRNA synthetase
MRTSFPAVDERWIDQKTEDEMAFVQNVINAVRNIRGENNIAPSKEIRLQVRLADGTSEEIFQTYNKYLQKLARVSGIEILAFAAKPKLASSAVVDGSEIFVPLEGLIDLGAERARLEKEIARLQQAVEATERKLANSSFVDRAPKEVVDREREKLAAFKATIEKLRTNVEHLS